MAYTLIKEDKADKLYSDFLDDCYGTINICGYDYDASHAFHSIDESAYRQGFLNFLDRNELELE